MHALRILHERLMTVMSGVRAGRLACSQGLRAGWTSCPYKLMSEPPPSQEVSSNASDAKASEPFAV